MKAQGISRSLANSAIGEGVSLWREEVKHLPFGIDVNQFVTEWTDEHIDEYLVPPAPRDPNEPVELGAWIEEGKHVAGELTTQSMTFLASLLIAAIEENNRVIAEQLRQAGIELPD